MKYLFLLLFAYSAYAYEGYHISEISKSIQKWPFFKGENDIFRITLADKKISLEKKIENRLFEKVFSAILINESDKEFSRDCLTYKTKVDEPKGYFKKAKLLQLCYSYEYQIHSLYKVKLIDKLSNDIYTSGNIAPLKEIAKAYFFNKSESTSYQKAESIRTEIGSMTNNQCPSDCLPLEKWAKEKEFNAKFYKFDTHGIFNFLTHLGWTTEGLFLCKNDQSFLSISNKEQALCWNLEFENQTSFHNTYELREKGGIITNREYATTEDRIFSSPMASLLGSWEVFDAGTFLPSPRGLSYFIDFVFDTDLNDSEIVNPK